MKLKRNVCDRQFDEAPSCRFEILQDHYLDINETSAQNLCPPLFNRSLFVFQYRTMSDSYNNTLSCNNESDYRP